MRGRDLTDLLSLAAIWGASFLFIKMAIDAFAPFALIQMRVGLAAASLLPLVILTGKTSQLFTHWKVLLASGMLNATLPFLLYAYAAQSLGASFLSVINAVTPAWGAAVGWLWFRDRLPRLSVFGLFVGFCGIVVLVWDKLTLTPVDGAGSQMLGTLAALGAPVCYGIGVNHTKRYLNGVDPIVNATGSLTGATLVLLPFAIYTWPTGPISFQAWTATILLAVLCTGFAYIMFFRLLASVGPTRGATVTFLAPVFGVFWAVFLLEEPLTRNIVMGAAIVLTGSALVIGGGRLKSGTGR